MIRNWEDIVEAICPGQSRHLATAKNAEGWLFRAWNLDRCPRITTRRVYRDDARPEFLAYPFTIEELRDFLK